MTLATSSDTWTGTATVNGGTFNVNAAQGPSTSFVANNTGTITLGAVAQTNTLNLTANNGGAITINDASRGVNSLATGSNVTINAGGKLTISSSVLNVPTFNIVGSGSTSAILAGAGGFNATTGGTANVMLADLAGNGNIAMGMGNMNIVDGNMLRNYGGTMTWTGNETIRFSAGTTSQNGQFASLNTSTFVVALNNKNAGGTLFLGCTCWRNEYDNRQL